MHHFIPQALLFLRRVLTYGLPIGLLMLIALAVIQLESRPALSLWHTVELDSEFTASQTVENYQTYLEIEERVFQQLDELVYQRVPEDKRQRINRYSRGSLSEPGRHWSKNWNRSFELPATEPAAGVLLLHGMSDSPYSLRNIGQTLNAQGNWVVGLRYPGHGTAPSGLTSLRWEDMAQAVELAMRHLKQKVGSQPIYIVGYSAGGGLAIHYALKALRNNDHPQAAGMVMISPAIGVTPLASLAVWQGRLGYLLGQNKLEWTDIKPEYDPYKYNSFAVNAGDQVYRLTIEISRLLAQGNKDAILDKLPPILAFQSSVDATVSSKALLNKLFYQLPAAGHHLMLFDINRRVEMEPLLVADPNTLFSDLLGQEGRRPFDISVLVNSRQNNAEASIIHQSAFESTISETSTGLNWPADIYSLSHVALPFSPDDPLYGSNAPIEHKHIYLGDFATRGERGVLQITPNDMLRLRSNPFYSVIESEIFKFLKQNKSAP